MLRSAQTAVRDFMRMAQSVFVREALTAPVCGALRLDVAFAAGSLGRIVDGLTAKEDSPENVVNASKLPSVLGARLMIEELGEVLEAMSRGDTVELADGLADLIYVTLWTANAHGIRINDVFEAVHAANMAKFPMCVTCERRWFEVDTAEAGKVWVRAQNSEAALCKTGTWATGYVATGRVRTSEPFCTCGMPLSMHGPNEHYFDFSEAPDAPCVACEGKGRVVIRDAGGKVRKPEGWTPPNIAAVLAAQPGIERTE